MFNFLFKKENRVEELLYSYIENFNLIQEHFDKAILSYMGEGQYEEFDFLKSRTHKFESKADDIIDEINNLMYGKVLIPDSRQDIMFLLHSIDKIPGTMENILFSIKYQQIEIPSDIILQLKDLIRISMESCRTLSKQIKKFIENKKGIRSLLNIIDKNESHCDYIEKNLIKHIFNSEIDPFLILQLKELIINIGNISDQADIVSKQVNILSIKRRV
ncbi:MAG: DUF47 family protein [Desulfobacteraceae bacterium]|nr:DUF47 family protein [Desulfobacteraceae bacterium]